MSHPDILRLEELTLSTSPATYQAFFDGWVLRASGTDTRRANSATALQPSQREAGELADAIEKWYARQGQPPIFRLTRELSPEGLDAELARRGYAREVETQVMTLDLSRDLARPVSVPQGVKLVERTPADGLADTHHLKHSTPEAEERDAQRQALWRGPELFVSLKTVNGLASTGMARIEGEDLGLFNLRTATKARGKGYASILVAYLLTWGQAQGARRAFLQVDVANAPAVALYGRFGFVTRYVYWHRVGPAPA